MAEPMTIDRQETAGLAVFNLIAEYPELPFDKNAKTLQWQGLGTEEGIGVFVTQGAYYLKKYISGSYVGITPLRIVYKTNPTSNKGRATADKFLNELVQWLSTCTADFEDEHITLEKIERTSPVVLMGTDESGFEQYVCSLNVQSYYHI